MKYLRYWQFKVNYIFSTGNFSFSFWKHISLNIIKWMLIWNSWIFWALNLKTACHTNSQPSRIRLCQFQSPTSCVVCCPNLVIKNYYFVRDGFKTQPPVDRRFRPVPPCFYCSKQWQSPGTGRNRRSTGGWVLKPPLISCALTSHLSFISMIALFKH